MAIKIDGVTLRNVPEQVNYLTEYCEELDEREAQDIASHDERIYTLEEDNTTNKSDIANLSQSLAQLAASGTITGGTIPNATITSLNAGTVAVSGNETVSGSVTAGSISAGSSSVSGNSSIGGVLSVTGTLTAGSAKIFENIEDANGKTLPEILTDGYTEYEGDLTPNPVAGVSGITFSFVHWRISNGKLNIVIAGKINNLVTNPSGLIVGTDENSTFAIPSFAWNALYPNIPIIVGVFLGILDSKVVSPLHLQNGYYSEGWTEASPIAFTIMKITDNRISISIGAQSAISMTDNKDYTFRAEFNFML